MSGTLTDSGKTFNTTKNNAACPANHWVVITGGTGSGQVRAITNNTATVLTTVPAWTVIPDTSSTYAIIKAEATLQNSGATETVQAGIYLPDLPTSSQTDSSVGFADHSITGQDPLLSDSTGLTFAAMTPASNSPAVDVGYGAAGTDIGAVAVTANADGVCGSNNGSSFDTLTSGTANNCTTGAVTGFTGSGPWSWTCAGVGSGNPSGTCTASLNTYTVTPAAGAHGSMSPSGAQTVNYGATTSFTVTPNTCYTTNTVSGCGGSLVGSTFTTAVITGNCTVTASQNAVGNLTVTPSAGANGTINPSTPQTVACGGTQAFTVTPSAGFNASIGGTCGGSLVGTTFTTGAVTANCSVSANFLVPSTGNRGFSFHFGFGL
jgi:hypothetical protein